MVTQSTALVAFLGLMCEDCHLAVTEQGHARSRRRGPARRLFDSFTSIRRATPLIPSDQANSHLSTVAQPTAETLLKSPQIANTP